MMGMEDDDAGMGGGRKGQKKEHMLGDMVLMMAQGKPEAMKKMFGGMMGTGGAKPPKKMKMRR